MDGCEKKETTLNINFIHLPASVTELLQNRNFYTPENFQTNCETRVQINFAAKAQSALGAISLGNRTEHLSLYQN